MSLAAGFTAAVAGAVCGWPTSLVIRGYAGQPGKAAPHASADHPTTASSSATTHAHTTADHPTTPGSAATAPADTNADHPATASSSATAGAGRAGVARISPAVLACAAGVVLAGLAATAAVRLHPVAVTAACGWLAACGLPLAIVDITARRLPDPLTGAAFAGVAGALLAAAITTGSWGQLGRAAGGAAVVFAFFAALVLLRPGSAGPGDAKLGLSTGALAAWCGWGIMLASLFAAFALAALYGLALLGAGRTTLRSGSVPFGPFLLAGCIAIVLISAR
jgi:leader peptidase (prepilin peptidase) / N-methyltransferase